jgi:hypothetical protein
VPARAPVAALGFTIKSGWTAAVVIAGSADDAQIAASQRLEISDPDLPESRQPYHEGFGTARGNDATLKRLIASTERYGAASIATFISSHRGAYAIHGAGLVVGSVVDPATIPNDHIRIHALEGQLFREVVRRAAAAARVDTTIWRERDLYRAAAEALKVSEAALKRRVTNLGRGAAGPWRAEQKAAATAALLVLASAERTSHSR